MRERKMREESMKERVRKRDEWEKVKGEEREREWKKDISDQYSEYGNHYLVKAFKYDQQIINANIDLNKFHFIKKQCKTFNIETELALLSLFKHTSKKPKHVSPIVKHSD